MTIFRTILTANTMNAERDRESQLSKIAGAHPVFAF